MTKSPARKPFSNASDVSSTSITSNPFASNFKPRPLRILSVRLVKVIPNSSNFFGASGTSSSSGGKTARAKFSSSRRPKVTLSVRRSPSRSTITSTAFPTGVLPTVWIKSRTSSTSCPSKTKITSFCIIPASLEGPSGTPETNAPATRSSPAILSAISSSTS